MDPAGEAAAPEGPPAAGPRPLAVSATWRLAGTIARLAIGFLTVPILIRTLGMEQWGLLALFQTASAPLLLLDVGFGAAGVKYVAEAVGRGDRAEAVRVIHTTLLCNALMGAAGAAALVLAAPWLASGAFAVPPTLVDAARAGFRITAVGWFLGIASAGYLGTLSGHQRYDLVARFATLSTFLTSAAGVVAALLSRDACWVIGAQTAVMALLVLAYRAAAERVLPGSGGLPRWDRATFRRSARFGRWHVTAVAGGMLSGWSDRYVLGTFFTPVVVGFYAVPHTLYIQLYGIFGELGDVLFPAVSHRTGIDDLSGARRLVLIAGWTLTGAFGVCAAVVAAVGGDFLHLWASPDVARETTFTLRLLCAAGIVAIAAVAPFHYVLGLGRPRWNAASSVLMGLTTLGVSLAVVPRLGLPGVGFGLLAGVLVRWIPVALVWWRHFRPEVRLGAFAMNVWAPAASSFLLLLGLSWAHDALAVPPSWPWLLLESAGALAGATAAQVAIAELLPGGPARRRDVVASFWPVLRPLVRRGRERR